MQVAIHAIGDKANDEVAALYQSLPMGRIYSSNNTDNPRSVAARKHRIEHAQHLSGPSALDALRDADVVAVTNPLHLLSDLDIIEAKLGLDRAKPGLAFPTKALLQVCLCPTELPLLETGLIWMGITPAVLLRNLGRYWSLPCGPELAQHSMRRLCSARQAR